jgi:hypothetical protein
VSEPAGAGGPDAVAATLAAFLAGSGARSAVAVVDTGDAEPVLVECDATDGGWVTEEGEEPRPAMPALPLPLPHLHTFELIEVDASRAEVTAPMGAIAHLAGATLELAQTIGGRSVLTAEFATTDPVAPLTIAARPGDPILLVIGEEQFAMPLGWPDPEERKGR